MAETKETGKVKHIVYLTTSWRPYALLALAVLGLYAQTLSFGYTGHDDIQLLEQKAHLLSDPGNIGLAFTTDVVWGHQEIYYRPVLTLSFMADAFWGGVRPFSFHLGDILIHLAAVLLLFVFIKRLTESAPTALITSLLFAVHPLLARAVAWIPGRNDSLLTVWVLASFLFYLEYNDWGKGRNYLLHLLFFFLALLTKETAVFVPVLAVLSYCLIPPDKKARSKPRLGLLFAGWALCLAGYYLLRHNAISAGAGLSNARFNTLAENLTGFVSYVGKIFFPFRLSGDPIPADLPLIYGLAVIVLISGLFFLWGIKDRGKFIFGLAWFLLFLLPTFLGNTTYANFAEHRLYLPLCGLAVMLLQLNINIQGRAAKSIAASALILVLALFTLLNVLHTRSFASGLTHWGKTVKNSPHSYHAHNMLGRWYAERGNWGPAEKEFKISWELNPAHTAAGNDLGLLYLAQGQTAKAESLFTYILQKDSNSAGARNNLGLIYMDRGQWDMALEQFQQSVKLQPKKAQGQDNLGLAYFKKGMWSQAEQSFLAAYRIDPGDQKINYHLASLYYIMKDYPKAVHHYDQALSQGLEPDPRILEALKPYRR
ncbi:MAG: tetratricopeptide repeat protein [bacterium]|nr:tetratricopeptide repeat protein [bacterium]